MPNICPVSNNYPSLSQYFINKGGNRPETFLYCATQSCATAAASLHVKKPKTTLHRCDKVAIFSIVNSVAV